MPSSPSKEELMIVIAGALYFKQPLALLEKLAVDLRFEGFLTAFFALIALGVTYFVMGLVIGYIGRKVYDFFIAD